MTITVGHIPNNSIVNKASRQYLNKYTIGVDGASLLFGDRLRVAHNGRRFVGNRILTEDPGFLVSPFDLVGKAWPRGACRPRDACFSGLAIPRAFFLV